MNVHGDTWSSLLAQPISDKTGVVDERIGELIQEVLSQRPNHPEHKVIVLPPEGKAKCVKLNKPLDKQTCELFQESELAIKTFLEWNKSILKQTGQWATYLKALECFARQKEGFLDTYLESELSKEAIRKLLLQGATDKTQLSKLMKKAFVSSASLDMSDLWILDQIPRLGLMEYLNGGLPISIDKIQAAVYRLATTLKPIDIIDSSNPSLFKGLAIWLIDSNAEGNKKEAVNRIIKAWVQTSLNLSSLGLNKIPPEIGQLTKLKDLNLENNNLLSLPPQIGQLAHLQELYLYHNNIQLLPPEIGQLANLQKLGLSNNNLQSLPPEIGQLVNLLVLYLDNNNLQLLPPTIGQLLSLRTLLIDKNPNLRDLPMSMGNIPGLTYLDIERTQITRGTVNAILGQCRVMRDREAIRILPNRLKKWQTIAKSSVDLTGIQSLEDHQKRTLNEWLLRLERTRDFAEAQGPLAEIVCKMLEDVIKNKDFRELFFAQAEANNEACEDRSAMSLNEIYTSWKILNMPEDTPLRQKLELMARGAKTITLRNKIDELIAAEERKKFLKQISALEKEGVNIDRKMRENIQKQCEEHESVEIFLNYETALKQKLNLLSAIENMSYRTIGERSWINRGELEKHVNENFFNELYELPVFQKELLADPAIQAKMGEIDDFYGEKLYNLPKESNEQQFLDYTNEITQQQKEAKMKVAKDWYKRVS